MPWVRFSFFLSFFLSFFAFCGIQGYFCLFEAFTTIFVFFGGRKKTWQPLTKLKDLKDIINEVVD
jgi:hypothetical protein